jgi:2-phosphosulfolactate phosphatase
MTCRINVYLLPELIPPEQLTGKTIVVIDVLRATTTIVHALAAGAKQVIPCLEIEEARQLAFQHGNDAVLGGERGGVRIEGFHLGNSPAEYTPAAVAGKSVVFTTTNGTQAMRQCRASGRVLIGAFVNYSRVCRELANEAEIEIICAGTQGEITREDTLLAGAIVTKLERSAGSQIDVNDQAAIAADAWQSAVGDISDIRRLAAAMKASQGGRNLIETGQQQDIEIAAYVDKLDTVPQLDVVQWSIR